ncbi:pentapeptide repeat-containing protein, partial [Paenibacillus sp. MCAF20]
IEYIELTINELKELIRSGHSYFSNIEVIEVGEVINFNCDGLVFEECMMMIDFTGSSFRNAKFINSNIKTSIFRDTDLSDSEFINNSIDACVFSNANIEGIKFINNTQYSNENTIEDLIEMVKD